MLLTHGTTDGVCFGVSEDWLRGVIQGPSLLTPVDLESSRGPWWFLLGLLLLVWLVGNET